MAHWALSYFSVTIRHLHDCWSETGLFVCFNGEQLISILVDSLAIYITQELLPYVLELASHNRKYGRLSKRPRQREYENQSFPLT